MIDQKAIILHTFGVQIPKPLNPKPLNPKPLGTLPCLGPLCGVSFRHGVAASDGDIGLKVALGCLGFRFRVEGFLGLRVQGSGFFLRLKV